MYFGIIKKLKKLKNKINDILIDTKKLFKKFKLCKVFMNEVIIFDNIVKMVFLIRGFDDYSLYL